MMVTRNEYPTKKGGMWSVIMVIRNKNLKKENVVKRKLKGQQCEEKAHMQDSATVATCAVLMPSSNALQVLVMLLISCGVHQMKSMDVSNSILSLHL